MTKLAPRAGIVISIVVLSLGAFLPAAMAGNRIKNGSFETSDFTGWHAKNMPTPYIAWNVTNAPPLGIGPVPSGTYFAQNGFDGVGPGSYLLWQKVRIPPAGQWKLSWKDAFTWSLSPGSKPRSQYVEIRTTHGKLLDRVYKYSTPGGPSSDQVNWTRHSVNLTRFAGTKVRICFRQYIPQDHTGPGNFQIDDIRLKRKS